MSWALEVAARTLWQEARGEPLVGQQAVAHVIWNRVRDGRWGPNLATVCLWKAQFSGWYVPSDPNFRGACLLGDGDALLARMRDVIVQAGNAPDPTNGALFYYANSMDLHPPGWAARMIKLGTFGSQHFFTDKGTMV